MRRSSLPMEAIALDTHNPHTRMSDPADSQLERNIASLEALGLDRDTALAALKVCVLYSGCSPAHRKKPDPPHPSGLSTDRQRRHRSSSRSRCVSTSWLRMKSWTACDGAARRVADGDTDLNHGGGCCVGGAAPASRRPRPIGRRVTTRSEKKRTERR